MVPADAAAAAARDAEVADLTTEASSAASSAAALDKESAADAAVGGKPLRVAVLHKSSDGGRTRRSRYCELRQTTLKCARVMWYGTVWHGVRAALDDSRACV